MKQFYAETADRAVKSFLGALIVTFGMSDAAPVGSINAFDLDWSTAVGYGLGMSLTSVVFSLASHSLFPKAATDASVLRARDEPTRDDE